MNAVSSALTRGLALLYIALLVLIPVGGLLLKVADRPPALLWAAITNPVAVATYQLTLVAAIAASGINCLFGLVLAWILERYAFAARRLANALVDLPFVMPAAVAGITLAVLYGPEGPLGPFLAPGTLLGGFLKALGLSEVRLAYSQAGVVLAMIFVTLPFAVRTLQPVIAQIEPETEEAALSLGASPLQTFWRVLLPEILPALLTSFALCFARGVGEYGAAVLISGNIPYESLITSVYIYQRLEEYDYTGATAVSLVLLVFSLAVLVGINLLESWSRRADANR
ncbi:sulfate ABC transporter permease subunit CysT [Gloeobacter kilaueensis]|uniref:Sulfate transport system permease protein CysT n=1 Tax=Gloeobacter kilaueensis (strain ATCC BAA-2537 / CCAP 1431/1 / ULC 316 / JS1) TaxID=1183438 RepID=U5QIT5_GLOK1|nr:sulfate ABC transporter permease subunit CysT [Gloeobacter kilaueensis]AGY57534.1 sulfate ABC transporter inner membrane subunit CysT [Gloeobacter kilaueensis JS1]